MPLITGVVVRCRPIGMLKMDDEAGGDAKILAVPIDKLSSLYRAIESPRDLPEITLAQIAHFFEHYKDLEPGKWVRVSTWVGAEEAKKRDPGQRRALRRGETQPEGLACLAGADGPAAPAARHASREAHCREAMRAPMPEAWRAGHRRRRRRGSRGRRVRAACAGAAIREPAWSRAPTWSPAAGSWYCSHFCLTSCFFSGRQRAAATCIARGPRALGGRELRPRAHLLADPLLLVGAPSSDTAARSRATWLCAGHPGCPNPRRMGRGTAFRRAKDRPTTARECRSAAVGARGQARREHEGR